MSDLGPSDLVHCPHCGRDLPASEFHRNRRRPNGLAYYCKTCARQRMEVSRRKRGIAARRAAQVDVPAGMKWCPDCDQIKPIVDFARTKASSSGIHSYCKPCHSKRGRETVQRLHGSTREYHLRRRYRIGQKQFDAPGRSGRGLRDLRRARPSARRPRSRVR